MNYAKSSNDDIRGPAAVGITAAVQAWTMLGAKNRKTIFPTNFTRFDLDFYDGFSSRRGA